jgi:hypothetical protein
MLKSRQLSGKTGIARINGDPDSFYSGEGYLSAEEMKTGAFPDPEEISTKNECGWRWWINRTASGTFEKK